MCPIGGMELSMERKEKLKVVINTCGMYKTWKMINRPGI